MARGLVAAHDGTLGVAGIRKKDEENAPEGVKRFGKNGTTPQA